MSPGDPLGNHGQRPISLTVVFEPILAHEDGMGVSTPLPHQRRAGLRHDAGIERTRPFLELCRQNPHAALQSAARAAMGALLQLIGEPPDDQIATEAEGRSSVMYCPPRTPQLLGRPIDQPSDFAIKLSQGRCQVNLSRSEKPDAGCVITLPPPHSAIRPPLRLERSAALIARRDGVED